MENNNNAKTIDQLLVEYKTWDLAQNPHGKVMENKTFNPDAQVWNEKRRLERDLKLVSLVEAIGQDKIPYVTVKRGPKAITLVYNTDAEELNSTVVHWITVPAPATTGGMRKYITYARGILTWEVRVLDGSIKSFMFAKLKDWIATGKFKTDNPGFAKDVAKFMRTYPHKNCNLYKKYFDVLVDLLKPREPSAIVRLSILKDVADNLKLCIYKDDREKMDRDQIYAAVKESITIPHVTDCSKKCNAFIAKYDPESIRVDISLNSLEKEAAEEERRMQMMNSEFEEPEIPKEDSTEESTLKRKREDQEGEDQDAQPEKKIKTDTQ